MGDIPEADTQMDTICPPYVRVSADWVLHSADYNEFMCAKDYVVSEDGVKIIDKGQQLSVDDMMNLLKEKSSEPEKCSNRKLAAIVCPDCNKTISQKGFKRHQRERHSEDASKFKCNLCQFASKRPDQLLDHQRRQHFEPSMLGRPNKKAAPRRRRSPFRVKDFRHTQSLSMVQAVDNKFGSLEKQVDDLKQELREKDMDLQQTKIRLSILEKKQKKKNIPDLNDTKALLSYFGLAENCTIDEIRDTINIEIMQVSPESLVGSAMNDDMTEEEKDEQVSFLNRAAVMLSKWKENEKI